MVLKLLETLVAVAKHPENVEVQMRSALITNLKEGTRLVLCGLLNGAKVEQ